MELLLSPEEVKDAAGGYSQPAKQLAELQRQGFWRARRSPMTGQVILERAHYEAVCAGQERSAKQSRGQAEPQLRPA